MKPTNSFRSYYLKMSVSVALSLSALVSCGRSVSTSKVNQAHAGDGFQSSFEHPSAGKLLNEAVSVRLEANPLGYADAVIEIDTLPSGNGFAPAPSLVYSSSQTEFSTAGIGWTLAASQTISRCPSHGMFSGKFSSILWSNEDSFCFDGKQILLVSGSLVQGDAEFRNFMDDQKRIKFVRDHFEVSLPSGDRQIFGLTEKSQEQGLKGTIYSYHLEKSIDKSGNTISYEYDKLGGRSYLRKISYGGNEVFSRPNYRFISFTYQVIVGEKKFVAGLEQNGKALLKEVVLGSYDAEIYKYRLHHEIVDHPSQPLFVAIDKCFAKLACTQKTSLRYEFSRGVRLNESPSYLLQDYASEKNPSWTSNKAVTTFVDINGDGFQDYLGIRSDSIAYSLQDAYGAQPITIQSRKDLAMWSPLVDLFSISDMNKDGTSDIVLFTQYGQNPGIYVAYWNGNGFGDFIQVSKYFGTDWKIGIHNRAIIDVNNDGWLDVIGSKQDGIYIAINQRGTLIGGSSPVASYFTAQQGWMNKTTPRYFYDVNGDGYVDVIGLGLSNIQVSLGTGDAFKEPSVWLEGFGSNTYLNDQAQPRRLADVNADGLVDLVGFGTSAVNVALNTGVSFSSPEIWLDRLTYGRGWNGTQNVRLIGDVNFDGYVDFIGFKWDGAEIFLGEGKPIVGKEAIRIPKFSTLLYAWKSANNPVDIEDIDSNGKFELISTVSKGVWKAEFDTKPVSLITVVDPFAGETSVVYRSIMESDVYKKTKVAAEGTIDIVGPMRVVARIDRPNGIGATTSTRFSYENATFHRDLFGFIGFEKRIITDDDSGIETVETYSLDTNNLTHGALISSETFQTKGPRRPISSTFSEFSSRGLGQHPLHRVLQERTNRTVFYDENGKLIYSVTTLKSYDEFQNPTLIVTKTQDKYAEYTKTVSTNYLNDVTNWVLSLPVEVEAVSTVKDKVESVRRKSRFNYDTHGLLISETIEPESSQSIKKNFSRLKNSYGLVDTTTISWGSGHSEGLGFNSITSFVVFDDQGFAKQKVNTLGHTSSVTRDALNGIIVESEDENGLKTSFGYDESFNLAFQIDPDSSRIDFKKILCDESCPKSAIFEMQSISSSSGTKTTYLDSLGRTVKAINPLSESESAAVELRYNSKGQLAQESEPFFDRDGPKYWTSYHYDERNRLVRIVRPDGYFEEVGYVGLDVVFTDAKGRKTLHRKDARGLLLSVDNPAGDQIVFEYDVAGRNTKIMDAEGNETTFEYDDFDRVVSSFDPTLGLTQFRWNALGLKANTVNRGRTLQLEYDPLGRTQSRTLSEAGKASQTEIYSYDSKSFGVGRLAKISSPNQSVEFTYDEISRPVAQIENVLGQEMISRTTYDKFGRVTSRLYPGGFSTEFIYDSIGRMKKVLDTRSKRELWSLVSLYADGNTKEAMFGNGAKRVNIIDPETKNLLSESVIAPDSTLQMARSYVHDEVGNLLSRQDAANGKQELFTYDVVDRLTSFSSSNNSAVTLKYDALGRIKERSDVGTYEYGPGCEGANASPFGLKKAGKTLYCRDMRGNLIRADGKNIDYDVNDLPTRMVNGSKSVEYIYGLDRSVIRKVETDKSSLISTTYGMSGDYEIINADGISKERNYVGNFLVVEIGNGNVENIYFYKDYLGSTLASADGSAQIMERMDYDPFGRRRDAATHSLMSGIKPNTTTYGFTGHDHIDSMDFIHMKGRVYDPKVGVFLTPDVFIQDSTNLQNFNRYSYVVNNPLRYNDPSGHFFRGIGKSLKKGFRTAGKALASPGSFLSNTSKKFGRAVQDPRYQRLAASLAVSVLATIYEPQWAAASWKQTAAYYAAVGYTSSYIQTNGDKKAALIGAVSGAAFNMVGSAFDYAKGAEGQLSTSLKVAKVAAHGAVGGATSVMNGGKFESGFLSAGLSEFSGQQGLYGSESGKGFEIASGTARAGIVGGAVSELSGGDFESGALSAAMGRLFNETAHARALERRMLQDAGISPREADEAAYDALQSGLDVVGSVPGPLGAVADGLGAGLYALEGDFASAMDSLQGVIGNENPKYARYMSMASRRSAVKDALLPTAGKIRYIPPKNWSPSNPLPRGPSKGYMDKFGNEWTKGPSRTAGQHFEWDVQRPNGSHWNISLDGKVTH